MLLIVEMQENYGHSNFMIPKVIFRARKQYLITNQLQGAIQSGKLWVKTHFEIP